MTWKDEIKKKDEQFIGKIYLPNIGVQKTVDYNSSKFLRILDKGNKWRSGLKLSELKEMVKCAERINEQAPKLLAWAKSELKKQEWLLWHGKIY